MNKDIRSPLETVPESSQEAECKPEAAGAQSSQAPQGSNQKPRETRERTTADAQTQTDLVERQLEATKCRVPEHMQPKDLEPALAENPQTERTPKPGADGPTAEVSPTHCSSPLSDASGEEAPTIQVADDPASGVVAAEKDEESDAAMEPAEVKPAELKMPAELSADPGVKQTTPVAAGGLGAAEDGEEDERSNAATEPAADTGLGCEASCHGEDEASQTEASFRTSSNQERAAPHKREKKQKRKNREHETHAQRHRRKKKKKKDSSDKADSGSERSCG